MKLMNWLPIAGMLLGLAAATNAYAGSRPTEVNVLVAYTPRVLGKVGPNGLTSLIEQAIANTNTSFVNSKVDGKVRLVGTYQANYTETTLEEALLDICNNQSSNLDLNDVTAKRDEVNADVIVFLINEESQAIQFGVATSPNGGHCTNTNLSPRDMPVAIVQYQHANAPYYTFTHELGHVLGADHSGTDPSPYTYGHGYDSGAFSTIMAFKHQRILHWSNPWVSFNGIPTGTIAGNDNARSLNNYLPFAATYRNPNSQVMSYNSTSNSWVMLDNHPAILGIVAGTTAMYERLNDGAIWRWNGTTWDKLRSGTVRSWEMPDIVSMAAGDTLYILKKDGAILKSTGVACVNDACNGWQQVDSNVLTKSISVGGSTLYKQHQDGSVHRYLNGTWAEIDTDPSVVAVVATPSTMFELTRDGQVYRFDGVELGWTPLGGNSLIKSIVSSGNLLYAIQTDGKIIRYYGSGTGWTVLDRNPESAALAADGSNLYQLRNDGSVHKFTGTVCSSTACPGWQLIGSNVNTTAIEAAHSKLYQLRR